MMRMNVMALALSATVLAAGTVAAQSPRALLPIDFPNSAEFAWLGKTVHASRVLDDMTQPANWRFTGTGRLTFPATTRPDGMRALRVDMEMFTGAPAPTASRLSSINLQRRFDG
jgi:hypothetical protein